MIFQSTVKIHFQSIFSDISQETNPNHTTT